MRLLSGTCLIALALVPAGVSARPQTGSATSASDKAQHYALGYFLPKGRATVNFSQRLVRCPTADEPRIQVRVDAQILAKAVPDYSRLYRIDARAGFLAKRQTDLSLHEDGTIKAINAIVEGQGSAVIASVSRLLSFGALIGAGGTRGVDERPPPKTQCRKEIAKLLVEREALATHIADLEAKYAGDGTLTSSELDELGYQRKHLAELDNALTLSSDSVSVDPSATVPIKLGRLSYKQWFEPLDDAEVDQLPGNDGVLVRWTVNAAARDALAAAAYIKADEIASRGKAAPPEAVLYYRRPVPVTITVTPCTNGPSDEVLEFTGNVKCAVDKRPDAAALTTNRTAGFPQLSGLFRLPIGRGGLFGSRSVAAEFNGEGAPLQLKYGSTSGAADIATAMDAARDTGATWQNRKQEALERQAAELRLRKEIRELEAALEKE